MISGRSALVVDDEESDCVTIARVLRKHFSHVVEAASYSDAMAMFDLHRDSVGFLVTDIALPDGNGCALAIALRKQHAGLRVLFISGQVGLEICKYYNLDVDDLHFLQKPFDPPRLLSAVRRVLETEATFP